MSTLEELESDVWGPPEYDSHLVRRCHELRRKDLADFTTEDLRIMLGQRIGVPFLLPPAVDVLVADPLAEGDFQPGDLLRAVAVLPDDAWATCPGRRAELAGVLRGRVFEDEALRTAVADFLSRAAAAEG